MLSPLKFYKGNFRMETEKKLSIDEQLAKANEQFDSRLKAEGVRVSPKPEPKKQVKPKTRMHYVGEVAHQHFNEDDFQVYEVDCKYINHTVRDKKGFTINGKRYQGKVIVPQCVANYLGMMESRHRHMERGVFEDRGRHINYGEIRG